ncbi:hypothetical protein [Aliiroseovarius marinus]|uniref:hypothetical protein n=1 Tax=Aliiroseovarius marinus TaxID=2500159 RepID=UPI00105BEDA9|nr:hypothetical protein [Aliiroseovarius marinus]
MKNNKKSWKIEGDTLPADLREKLKDVFRQSQNELDALPRPLTPPWEMFPDYARTSMGWRMGSGETFMDYFREWFLSLPLDERQDYINSTTIPDEWVGWLEGIHP